MSSNLSLLTSASHLTGRSNVFVLQETPQLQSIDQQNAPSTPSNIAAHQIWLTNNPVDTLLTKLYELGVIDTHWLLKEPYCQLNVDLLEIDAEQISGMRQGEIDLIAFLDLCIRAARLHGGQIDSFSILGSFAQKMLDPLSMKKTLSHHFPQLIDDLEQIVPKELHFNDIDLRLEAVHGTSEKNFLRNLLSLNPPPLRETHHHRRASKEGQELSLDVENIKVGLADLVYCRIDKGENARTIHQTLRIDLLPLLLEGKDCQPVADLQTVLDLWCGIGHWIKSATDEWDWPAYVLMVTRGIRFAEEISEQNLIDKCLASAQGNCEKLAFCLRTFKKLGSLPDSTRMVYLLNGCFTIKVDGMTFVEMFQNLRPENEFLQLVAASISDSSITLETLHATLQLIGLRSLLKPSHNTVCPIELISHKGIPHLRFIFDDAFLVVPLNLNDALKTLSLSQLNPDLHLTLESSITRLLRFFSRGRPFSIDASSPLKINFDQIAPWMKIPLEELVNHFKEPSLFIQKVAYLLFASQIYLQPTFESFLKALEMTFSEQLQKFADAAFHQELLINHLVIFPKLERPYLEKAIKSYFSVSRQRDLALSTPLLYISNEPIFNLAITHLHDYHVSHFETVDHYLKLHKIGRALSILTLMLKTCAFNPVDWEPRIDQIIDFLISKQISTQNYEIIQRRTIDFGNLFQQLIEQPTYPTPHLDKLESLAQLFHQLGLESFEISMKMMIDRILSKQKEECFHRVLNKLKEMPSTELVRALITYSMVNNEMVIDALKALLEQLHVNQKNLILEILQMKEIIPYALEGHFDLIVQKWIQSDLYLKSKGFDFVMSIINFPCFAKKEIYLSLLKQGERVVDSQHKAVLIEEIVRKSKFLFPDPGEYLEVHMGLIQLQLSSEVPFSVPDFHNLFTVTNDAKTTRPLLHQSFLISIYKLLIQKIKKKPEETLLLAIALWTRDRLVADLNDTPPFPELIQLEYELFIKILNFYAKYPKNSRSDDQTYKIRIFTGLIQRAKWPKKIFQEFKTILLTELKSSPDEIPIWFCQLFDELVQHIAMDQRYVFLVDEILSIEKENKALIDIVRKHLKNWKALCSTKKLKTLPVSFIKIILESFEQATSCHEMDELGSMLLNPNFIDMIPQSDLSHVLENYFYKFLKLILSDQSPLMISLQAIWNYLKQDYLDSIFTQQVSAETQTIVRTQYLKISELFCANTSTLTTHALFHLIPLMVCPSFVLTNLDSRLKSGDLFEESTKMDKLIMSRLPPLDHYTLIPDWCQSKKEQILYALAQALLALTPSSSTMTITRNSLLQLVITFLSAAPSEPFISLFEHYLFSDTSELDRFDTIIHTDLLDLEIKRLYHKKIFEMRPLSKQLGSRKDFYNVLFCLILRSNNTKVYRFNRESTLEFVQFIFNKLEDPHSHFNDRILTRVHHIMLEVVSLQGAFIFCDYTMKFYNKVIERYPDENLLNYLSKMVQMTFSQVSNYPHGPKQLEIIHHFLNSVAPFVTEKLRIHQSKQERSRSDIPYSLYTQQIKIILYISDNYPSNQKNDQISRSCDSLRNLILDQMCALFDDDLALLYKQIHSPEFELLQKQLSLNSFLDLMTKQHQNLLLVFKRAQNPKLSTIWAAIFQANLILLAESKTNNILDVHLSFTMLYYWIKTFSNESDTHDYFVNLINFFRFIPSFYKICENSHDPEKQLIALTRNVIRFYLTKAMPLINETSKDLAMYCITQLLDFFESTYPEGYEEILELLRLNKDYYQPYIGYAQQIDKLPERVAKSQLFPLQDN